MAHAKQTKGLFVPETAFKAEPLKVLLYDLETSPNLGWSWAKWEQNIIEFLAERRIISFGWKWLGEKKSHCLALPDFKGYKPGISEFIDNPKNNRALVMKLHELFEQADVTVGHNVVDFDDKRSNTDFLRHRLLPPPPHKTVDTLKVARAKFDFNSNKLDDLGAFLGVGRKVKHPGFEMWKGCMEGNPESWKMMKKYNAGDVDLLEKIYLIERPWMTNHPFMNTADRARFACPTCTGTDLHGRGWSKTKQGDKQRFQCNDCGHWATATWVGRKDRKELRLA